MLDRTRSRLKDHQWVFTPDAKGDYANEIAILACLMDIRDELKRLNGLLHCGNFVNIPRKLERIARNTARKRSK